MEMPHLGQHCSKSMCGQLDFLPVKCDACEKIFCKDHFQYSNHQCPESYKKNKQVPVCPLCNTPIPVKAGDAPDRVVGDHIDRSCQSDPAVAKRKKVYTNKCSLKGCKQKEVVPIKCDTCQQNYCLKHRHSADHNCGTAPVRKPGQAAAGQGVFRMRTSTSTGSMSSSARSTKASGRTTTTPTSGTAPSAFKFQGDMNEDDALAAALQLSLMSQTANGPNYRRQDDEDYMLARAIAASQADEEERQRRIARQIRSRNYSNSK